MDAFNPYSAALGGTLIGLAAAVLWLGNGRIAGISGVLTHAWPPSRTTAWRIVFLIALIGGAWITSRLFPGLGVGGAVPASLVQTPNEWPIPTPVWLAIAGLLTGLGTRIGSGCTSGHGVCGIARLSRRSFAAVAIFFGTAIAVVTLVGVV